MTVLRPYQREAIDRIQRDWQECRATLLVLATGLGKSVCCSHLLRERPGRSLFLVHREELLQQGRGHLERVGLTVEVERAEEAALAVSMQPSDCVVASVQTLARERRLGRWPTDAFRTIVIDEAHRSAAKSYRRILAHFRSAKVLGLTATADRTDGIAMATVYDSNAMHYGIREGISDGWLVPLQAERVIVEDLDLKSVRVVAGDLKADELEEQVSREATLHQIADPLVRLSGSRPTLIFTPGVQSARELARVLAGYVGADRVASIDGETPRDRRAEILAAYARGEVQYVSNCLVLTEGFDAPPTACVALCRPTKSRSLLTQMIGRGTRTLPGTVDGIDSADDRRRCIELSAKPDLLVVDFTGRDRLDLVGPADVLAGEDLPDEAREVIRKAADDPADTRSLEEVLADAEEAAANSEEAQRLERRRARVQALTKYVTHPIELAHLEDHLAVVEEARKAARDARRRPCKRCSGSGINGSGKPCGVCRGKGRVKGTPVDGRGNPIGPTEKQAAFLERHGIKLPASAHIRQASAAIDLVIQRNLCSVRQARVLRKAGLRTSLTKAEAGAALSALSEAGWVPTPEIQARWG